MTKTFKKLLCLALTVILALSAITIVSAASDDGGFYTITIQNQTTGEIISEKAEGAEDMYDTFSAWFDDITAGDYEITVTYLNIEGGNSSCCATTTWTSQAAAGELDTIRVDYYVAAEEIGVSVTAIHPNAEKTYNVVIQNVDTEETSEATAEVDDIFGDYSAIFDGIMGGTYNVLVYALNSESGNNSLCASTTWTSYATGKEMDSIKVIYDPDTDAIDVEVIAVHPNIDADRDYTVVVKNTETEETFESKAVKEDDSDVVSAEFNELPRGTYDIIVYVLNEVSNINSFAGSTTWTCEAPEDGSCDIKVSFDTATDEIAVEVTQTYPIDMSTLYQLSIKDSNGNVVANDFFQFLNPTERPDNDYWYAVTVDKISAGTYTAQVLDANGAALGDEVSFAIMNTDSTVSDDNYTTTLVVYMDDSTYGLKFVDLNQKNETVTTQPTTVANPDNNDAKSSTNQSTSDTAKSSTTSNGAVQTGDASMAVVMLVLLVSAVGVTFFARKRMLNL
jgi:hypothetical protein